jgi:hypothetical protein
MKRVFIFLFVALPLMVCAENYFKEGTKWIVKTVGTTNPEPTVSMETFSIEGDTIVASEVALKLYFSGDAMPTKRLAAILRVDDQRVYFQTAASQGWTLLYDFGLAVGEGCTVGEVTDLWAAAPEAPAMSYVRCISTEKDPENPEVERMIMQVCDKSTLEPYPDAEGVWLRGIGSADGVLYNACFGEDGAKQTLVEVSLPDRVIYSISSAGIKATPKEAVVARIDGRKLTVSTPKQTTLAIYGADGRQMASQTVAAGSTTVALPTAGVYLVSIGQSTFKMIAR